LLDLLVIGAGIVGSWVAYRAALRGLTVGLCDSADRPGDGISGRNSGVLHAGLYYTPGSLKAKHCIRGRILTEEFCRRYNVPHIICGKLITPGYETRPDDEARLLAIEENALKCGAEGLEMVSQPGQKFAGVRGKSALFSSKTGVVDAPAYLKAVDSLSREAGVMLLLGRKFVEGSSGNAIFECRDGSREEISANTIVNAAGLTSDEVAFGFGLTEYEIRPNRGEYFRLSKRLPHDILVYPLPHTDSTALGVHYTFHLNGEAYAGPNSIWAENKIDYRITANATDFHKSLSRIISGYEVEDFHPGYAGLRPRLFHLGKPQTDFLILKQPERVIHLLGIESPGLTSAASISEEVVGML